MIMTMMVLGNWFSISTCVCKPLDESLPGGHGCFFHQPI